MVVSQASGNTTAYIGNLAPQTTSRRSRFRIRVGSEPKTKKVDMELLSLFQSHGAVLELRIQPERGFGFVRCVLALFIRSTLSAQVRF